MAQERFLSGCEFWPVPGFRAMGALATPSGLAPVSLAGPADAKGVVILAADELGLLRGMAAHAVRRGLGVIALGGKPGGQGEGLLRAAAELARARGAEKLGLLGHGAWGGAAVSAAPGVAEVVAVLDPEPARDVDPTRLRGIPLWIASGEERAVHARELHHRAQHPRALIELPKVPRLVHAVNDVAAEIIPFLKHGLG